MGSDTLQSVIDLAIQREEEAYNFYMNLSNIVEDKAAKETLKYLADEEAGHKAFLVKCKDQMSCDIVLRPDMPVDYRVAEHLKQPDVKKNMNSEEVFLIAANREINAHNFYKGLADLYPKGPVKELLLRMANEEMRHKEKMDTFTPTRPFRRRRGAEARVQEPGVRVQGERGNGGNCPAVFFGFSLVAVSCPDPDPVP